jgi:AcrR family transcriptional regulator
MTVVTKQAGSLRERKRVATRQAILAAAIALFSERGFESPTIEQIAASAEIGKGTVYNYFATKEEILVAFMVELEGKFQRRISRYAEAEGGLEHILTEVLWFQFRLKQPYLGFVRIFLAQLILRCSELQEHVLRMQAAVDPPMIHLFTRLRERGLIPGECDVLTLVHEFKCMHFGLSCLWAMEEPPFPNARAAIAAQVGWFAGRLERRTR